MSEDEDLYCNPQTNVFLQARLQQKPAKKAQDKKSLFKKKPPPSPKKKITPPRGVPASASAELGSLFKSGVTKPSELRKTAAPEKLVETSVNQNDDHVIDFRAHLRPVPSPIKTEAENRRCSVTSEIDLPPPPPENEDDENPPLQSPPVPKRSSTLRRPVPAPPSLKTELEKDPLKPFIEQNKQESDLELNVQEILTGPPPIEDQSEPSITHLRPRRRILQKPSKAPPIPLHTFPDGISTRPITNTTLEEDDCDEMYTENEMPLPEETCDELYTENYIPSIEGSCDELYTENDLPVPEEDCDEMYTENDLPMPDLPNLPPLYDSPKTPQLPERAVIEDHGIEEDEELYTDDVCDYPQFKPANPTPIIAAISSAVAEGDGDFEEIYEDAEFPLISETRPVDEYRPELEECEDIYDDIGSFNVSSVESPVPKPQPSPMPERQNFAHPSTLPPPPQLPISAPPPAAASSKLLKQKSGLFGGLFKKGKKKSVVESQVSQEQSVEEESPNCTVVSTPQTGVIDDDELYNDGEIIEYSDDDEPIYEDQ